jgi:hypothetical protein
VRWCRDILFVLLAGAGTTPVMAQSGSFTFENLADGTALTTQYSGATFSNTVVLTAGITLDEFEFPPHAGSNVASDSGGPMTIAFATPVRGVVGFFTYSVALTIQAYDSSNTLVASTTSSHSNNEALSGQSGSQPGEVLKVVYAKGISKIVITGAALGTSFTVDDLALITKCDINQDGQTSVTDAQAMVNESLGTAQPSDDLAGTGLVSGPDVQIVVNAILNRGCSAK